jgi:Family of unknown function (DUF6328)
MGNGTLPYTRRETIAQRADRRYGELLQELRVTQTGVQVLLGFLFTVVFSNRFKELNGDQRVIYLVTLILGASATAVLIAPVSFHRILFGRRMKPELVRAANRLTLLGLGLLMCTISSALLLVFDFMLHGSVVAWLAAGVAAWFVLLWYLVPLWLRLRRSAEWEEEAAAGETAAGEAATGKAASGETGAGKTATGGGGGGDGRGARKAHASPKNTEPGREPEVSRWRAGE